MNWIIGGQLSHLQIIILEHSLKYMYFMRKDVVGHQPWNGLLFSNNRLILFNIFPEIFDEDGTMEVLERLGVKKHLE